MKPFKAVFIAILLVSIQAPAIAAPSLLGMCHKDWNCDATKDMYRGNDTLFMSWLATTFGTKCSCVNELLNDPRPKIVRVHLANSACMRNRRCGSYEPFYGYNKTTASRAVIRGDNRLSRYFDNQLTKLKLQFAKSSNLVCYVSPCLECDLNERARRILFNRLSAALPQCIPVDNPYRQHCIEGYVCEGHGTNPTVIKPCIVDLDGIDGKNIDVKKWVDQYRHCDLAYYWEPWMNCIRGQFIDPRRRDCKYDSATFIRTRRILCRYFLRPLFGTC